MNDLIINIFASLGIGYAMTLVIHISITIVDRLIQRFLIIKTKE